MAPIKFGILVIPYQAIDVVGPLDVLNSSSIPYLKDLEKAGFGIPPGLIERGIEIEFYHVGETLDPITISGNLKVVPTTTCDTCPDLDYLLVGGPDPIKYRLPAKFSHLVRTHVDRGKGVFTTCTGGLCIAETGVLDGKHATTNHGAVDLAKHMYPKVNWTREQQWIVDGQFWTAGGACAGMDMMAHWVIENFGIDVAMCGLGALDLEPRDIHGNRVLPQQHGSGTGTM